MNVKKGPIIAIDGPAGTGKSSATKRVAEKLGCVYVDTGALYRAIAFLTKENLIRFPDRLLDEDAASVAQTAKLEFNRDPKRVPSNRVFANGADVTDMIRTPEVSLLASRVSAIPAVRQALMGLQRQLGERGWSILEGRDIGTVVFPNAELKFYLTASVEERAKRRLTELETLGGEVPSYLEIKAQISERDLADSTREVAPLKRAGDALLIDTTQYTLDEVVDQIVQKVTAKFPNTPASQTKGQL